MNRLSWFGLCSALLAWSIAAGPPAHAAAPITPILFSVVTGQPKVWPQGVQKSWPIKVSEGAAAAAVFQGGMWLTDPATGGRTWAKYQRHVEHANGIWTWIGSVETVHGDQSVTLTFGPGGVVFGRIPQASDLPLDITTTKGQTRIVATDAAALARMPAAVHAPSQPDYVVPPHPHVAGKTQAARAYPRAAAASAANPITIDVLVAYTPGLVKVYGSKAAALTRIQYLIDWTNQAYVNSKVYQTLRLVHTVQVDYTDANTDSVALDEMSKGTGALQSLKLLRMKYGADLVSLVRPFNIAAANARVCGNAYVGALTGDGAMWDSARSVVSDRGDETVQSGWNCGVNSFAHELGHNMGNAHDRGTASSEGIGAMAGGAYPYSYGYVSSKPAFGTIMSYSGSLQVFSNPDVTFCMKYPCGVADDAPDSADNAHSMNNTAPMVAAFQPTVVDANGNGALMVSKNDVDGDDRSDLLWMNASAGMFGYWGLSGNQVLTASSTPVAKGYRIVATGDFNGDGKVDLLWTSDAHDLYLWMSSKGGFVAHVLGTYPAGWEVVGAGDVDEDGRPDLLWLDRTTGTFGYWIMDGVRIVRTATQPTPQGFELAAIGDFDGDGKVDLLWRNPSNPQAWMYVWSNHGGSFTSSPFMYYVPKGQIVAAVDINGDGTSDLLFLDPDTHALSSCKSYFATSSDGTKGAFCFDNPDAGMQNISVAPGYTIAAVGDVDGDGRADLIWTSAARDLWLWRNNGGSFTSMAMGSYPEGWSAVPSQNMAWSALP